MIFLFIRFFVVRCAAGIEAASFYDKGIKDTAESPVPAWSMNRRQLPKASTTH